MSEMSTNQLFSNAAQSGSLNQGGYLESGAIYSSDFDRSMNIAPRLRSQYDFIVCGSGSSGSVVASRLSENPNVTVLLVEAGGSDDVDAVKNPGLWPMNWETERDWNFVSQPESGLNGRSLPMTM